MTRAYNSTYLEKAQVALADSLDFAVNDLALDLKEYFEMFIASGVAGDFECGDPRTVVGRSGIELTYEVLDKTGCPVSISPIGYRYDRTPEYWTGWALAYYQWFSAQSFARINSFVPIEEVRAFYIPYHEMDVSRFCERMDETMKQRNSLTNLKRLRIQLGLSQSELAKESGVPVRTIQQYEQRQKSINRAQAQCLLNLSGALYCKPTDLLERP